MGCNCGNKGKNPISQIVNASPIPSETCSCGKPKSECGKGDCKCKHEQKPCLEDHTKTLVESVYTTTVTATDTWVMPAVDDCVQLHLKDVTNILPGAILWNKSVGYLHVSSYDATTGYVTACNEGEEGNAEAGSDFPSCMAFHVGVPIECDCSDNWTGPCLAADVTSPGVGETTEVSVTTVSGLFIGDIIDIAGFMYKIVAINDVHTIVVKNEGYGAPLGTVIKNDPNCTGKPCTVKITVVNSDDPCAKDPVHEGVLIVCDEGERKPFTGTADNQITYWDNDDKTWKLKIIKLKEECTNLTVDLTLDPLITTYVVTVAKTSIFAVGDVVYIGDIKFTVDSKISATQMRITIDQAVPSITVIEEGSSICLGDCCENFDLPDKYSGVVTVPGSINNINIDDTGFELKNTTDSSAGDHPENHETHPNQSFSNTITITSPIPGKKVTLIGTVMLNYQGVGIGDSHYQTHDTGLHAFVYHVPPRVCLSGNVAITDNGTTTKMYPTQSVQFYARGINSNSGTRGVSYGTYSIDGLFTYNSFYSTPINNDGYYEPYKGTSESTDGSATPVSQALVLPVSITLTGNSSVTITITGNVRLLNARGKLTKAADPSQYFTDEVVALNVKQTTIATSLAWVIQ